MESAQRFGCKFTKRLARAPREPRTFSWNVYAMTLSTPRHASVRAKVEKIPISQVRKRGCAVDLWTSASIVFTFTTACGSRV